MNLLGIDVGTTHCKAGLFAEDGRLLHGASRATPLLRAEQGYAYYAPDVLWQVVANLVGEVTDAADRPRVAAIGIASMAETGLLVDRKSGSPRSPLLPWFDTTAAPQADALERQAPPLERFRTFGIYPSFKCSLAKILWLRDHAPAIVDGAIWLSAADYVAYRLSGALASDYSLAGRTYAFDLGARQWDAAWLRQLGLPDNIFPAILPSGAPVGQVTADWGAIGLDAGTPVAIGGHDHVCAAFAAGVTRSGQALDSMGTAEGLIGALSNRALGGQEFHSGLTFGVLPAGEPLYWLGGLSASGGSVEWLRGILGDPPLSYAELEALQLGLDEQPGEIIYLPYLAGSGAPRPNGAARGAFIGLKAEHGRADLLKAVLEGTAYQMEAVRRVAEGIAGQPIESIAAAGGGTRNRRWLQIKADVYGAPIDALALDEAALLGAALLAGMGARVYATIDEALAVADSQQSTRIEPNWERHQGYARLFETAFWPWQEHMQQRAQA